MSKVSIYIDGANFYLTALKLLNIKDANFDYESFAKFLADGKEIAPLGKRFYIGTVSSKRGDDLSLRAVARQNTLFTRLRMAGWEIKTSPQKKRMEEVIIDHRVVDYPKLLALGVTGILHEKYREKGTDVKIATDLLTGAIDGKYDTAMVVSSDTDLIPAIDWVRHRGKRVEYVGFSIPHPTDRTKDVKPTVAMLDRTDAPSRILQESDLRKFII